MTTQSIVTDAIKNELKNYNFDSYIIEHWVTSRGTSLSEFKQELLDIFRVE